MLHLSIFSLGSDPGSAFGIYLVLGASLGVAGCVTFWIGYRYGGRAYGRRAEVSTSERKSFTKAAELASMRQEVSEAREESRRKSRLLAHVSHEIRTPLHAIRGSIHLLRDAGALNHEQRVCLGNIEFAGETVLRLTHDLLDYCQIENRHLSLRREALLVDEAISQVVDLVRAARTGSAPIFLDPPPTPLPPLLGDSARLRQILTNVIGNAAKFTSAGEIRIRWRGVERADHWRLQIGVEDTGPGIPPAELGTLFQPFTPGAASRAHAVPGSGLGLCISRDLARMMAGDVTVASHPGIGTTVTIEVELPSAAAAPLTSSAPAPSPDALRFRGPRVLVAEDNPLNQTIAVKLLERYGCRVEVAPTARETLLCLRRESYDLLLLDCQLPDQTGPELAATIRQEEVLGQGRRLPIVAVTAQTDPAHRGRCLQAGMDGYLAKPLDLEAFRDLLALHLNAFRILDGFIFEAKRLDDLRRLDQAGALVREVIAIFLRSTPQRLARIRRLREAGDEAELAKDFHALRSSFGSMGLASLADACAAAEERLRAGHGMPEAECRYLEENYPAGENAVRGWQASYASAPMTGEREAAAPGPATWN